MLYLTGGWGYGNRGDDVILEGLLGGLGEAGPFELDLTSFSPDETFTVHGLKSEASVHRLLYRRRPGSLLRLAGMRIARRFRFPLHGAIKTQAERMAQADLIVFGGGGYFNEVWREAYPARKLEIELARDSGTEYLFVGQTFGPFSDRTARVDLGGLLRGASSISYRDRSSARVLELAGIDPASVTYVADLAHLVEVEVPPPATNGPKRVGLAFQNHRPYGTSSGTLPFGRHGSPGAYRKALTETVRTIAATGPVEFDLIPSTTWDEPFMRQIEKYVRDTGSKVRFHQVDADFDRFVRTCQSVDVLLSTNMHPVILASLAGVRSVALSYNFKLDDYMERIGRDRYCFRLDDFEPEVVADAVGECLRQDNPDPDLAAPVAEARAEAKRSLEPVLDRLAAAASGDRQP